ncbi:type II 3-dehydroquinate dehydratase [Rudaeicoccus suwonensis]|nr:type II 3-dehydroquinate dehydratase [Rudaeicoccus suwonensis]
MTRPTISIINGPNLNLLGQREPLIYGAETLADVEALCRATADTLGFDVECFQSNREGAIVEELHRVRPFARGVVINAAGYTHTSVAIRDALVMIDAPVMEVHISNVHAREEFRHHSFISDIAAGVIVGCGVQGYEFAINRIAALRPATAQA